MKNSENFNALPASAPLKALEYLLQAGGRPETLKNFSRNATRIHARTGGMELINEFEQIELRYGRLSSQARSKQIFNLLLLKLASEGASKRGECERVEFNISELVTLGLFGRADNALRGVKRALLDLCSIEICGSAKNGQITKYRKLFTGFDLEGGAALSI